MLRQRDAAIDPRAIGHEQSTQLAQVVDVVLALNSGLAAPFWQAGRYLVGHHDVCLEHEVTRAWNGIERFRTLGHAARDQDDRKGKNKPFYVGILI